MHITFRSKIMACLFVFLFVATTLRAIDFDVNLDLPQNPSVTDLVEYIEFLAHLEAARETPSKKLSAKILTSALDALMLLKDLELTEHLEFSNLAQSLLIRANSMFCQELFDE